MSPYYKVFYNSQEIIKGPKVNMGKNPKWTDFDKIDHNLRLGDGEVKIQIKNDGDLIGEVVIQDFKLVALRN